MAVGGGVALNLFTEFVNITGPTYLTRPREVVNDAQKTNYGTLGYMLRGQGMSDVLQGGSDIRDYIYLSSVRRARSYKPNQRQTYSNPQTGVTWKIDWRFFLTDMVWTDEEIILNAGGNMSQEAKFQAYKDLYWRKQQDLYTDQMNFFEELFWAAPSNAEMEAAGGQEMFSIPCFIHGNDLQGTAGQVQTAEHPLEYSGGSAVAWTTIANINPDTADGGENWANIVLQYGDASGGSDSNGFTVGSIDNVLHFLDMAYHATDFRPPPMFPEYFENPQKQQRPGPFIACSLLGKTRLMFLYRESKDLWIDMKDPFFNPTYAGSPIVYIAQLDTAALYDNDDQSALVTEITASGGGAASAEQIGPRYYGVQPQYLRPVFHTDRYFTSLGVMTDVEQPTTHVMPVNTYANLAPRSRNRHFLLAPLNDHV